MTIRTVDLGSVVGPQGPQGAKGDKGEPGVQGVAGAAGKSAYQSAVTGGYTGTEAALNSALGEVPGHIVDTAKHITAAERTTWNGKASAADLTSHTGNTTVHVTAAERTTWNGKAAASVLTSHTGNKANPHGVTAAQVGAAASNHTHTAAQVGAAVPSRSVSATLSTSWSGSGPYTQSVTVSGMTANTNGSIGLAANATAAQREAARDAMLAVTAQGTNSLTVTADGDKPTVSLPVVVTILG